MPRSFQQADLCSGWRSDGTMMIAVYAGEPLPFEPLADVPQLPDGADGWPDVDDPDARVSGATAGSTSFPTVRRVADRRVVPRHVPELRR